MMMMKIAKASTHRNDIFTSIPFPPSNSVMYLCSRNVASFHSQTHLKFSAKGHFKYGFDNLDDDDALTQFDRMLRMRPLPSIVQFNKLLTSIAKSKHYSTVISLFRKMDFSNFVTLNIVINCFCNLNRVDLDYSTVIDRLCKDRLVTEALKLFSDMIDNGISPNVITYTSLIQGVCCLGEWKEAIRLLNEMLGKNVSPNVQTFTILVDALCEEGMAKEAQYVVELMIQRGVVPNVVTYNAVMDGYCLCGQVDEARKMLDVMVSRDCAPDVVTYNTLINGYCKSRRIDEAMTLFKGISQKNTVTYSNLGLCQVRKPRDALLLLDEMQTHGQIPNLFTYSALLDGLCNNQRLPEAVALFKKLENAGLAPNIVIYSNLIEGMCKDGKLDDARELYLSLSAKGLKPNVRTHNIMINGLCKEGLLDEAYELLRKMEENGCSPDFYSYNIIIHGFLQNNETLKELQLLHIMADRAVSVDPSTATLYLTCCLMMEEIIHRRKCFVSILVPLNFLSPLKFPGATSFSKPSLKFPVRHHIETKCRNYIEFIVATLIFVIFLSSSLHICSFMDFILFKEIF
ncbi:hypothetical protein ACSBR1_007216 [Camellia fascicularis]